MSFEIKTNEKVGRFAVATKDLKAGDVIFEEEPFAFGPKSEHPPMCLGCYAAVDCSTLCSKCSWPVCNEQCEQVTAHKDAECKVFAACGQKFQPMEDVSQISLQMECVTPLRVLLAMESNKQRWDTEVAPMTAHLDQRKTQPIWQYIQTNVVKYLRGPCKLDRFSEELIHQICGVLDINAFEAHPSPFAYSIRCLYPKLAILSHNCVSNIAHSINPEQNFKLQVRSALEVKNGAELFSSYVYPILPTLTRRAILRETKYFDCTCDRCKDPTELGTNMGTLKCSKCDNGVILSSAPLEEDPMWKCTHCEFSTKASNIQSIFKMLQTALDNVDAEVVDPSQAIEARESIYRKYKSVLHPQNWFHTQLRISLAQMYGQIEGYSLDDLPNLLLERKVELCQLVLQNLNVVDPGYTRTRGLMLYALHAPLLLLAKNSMFSGEANKEQVRAKLNEAIKYLEESIEILKLEPLNTSEGQLAVSAAQSLVELKANVDLIVNIDV